MTTTARSSIFTYREAIAHAHSWLEGLTDTPALDAQVLLSDITGKGKSHLLAHPEESLDEAQLVVLDAALKELENGIPLPYVLGEWEFYGLPFKLTQNVLIPRPETELLVETALSWLKSHPSKRHVAEVGAGSGCISIALAVNCPRVVITATEISPIVLNVAEINACLHEVDDRVTFLQNNLLANLETPFDLILANLPYIPTDTLKGLPVYTKEPTLALDGGPDGLDLIRELLAQAPPLLNPGGLLLLEIEAGQGEHSRQLAQVAFPHAGISVKRDLAGRHRLLSIQTL
ncbi:MAG: peptide chain release factor N(5)-glutamine methyltransferase [Anaerolineales bacterium]|jgi:release factor glutamine methyltransferase